MNYLGRSRDILLGHTGAVYKAGNSLGVNTVAGQDGFVGKVLEVLELHVPTKDKAHFVPVPEHKAIPVPAVHHKAVDQ